MNTKNINPETDKMIPCPCCGRGDFTVGMYVLLQAIRTDLNKPLTIHSGARCWAHQLHIYEELGTPPVKNSDHLIDEAELCNGADISVEGMSTDELYNYLVERSDSTLLAIGKYYWGIHVGLRGYPARW
jgi:hypothetical protein